ncbi:site-specific DNA-methyltransferase [Methylomonas sp. HYX-M1]|uniref:site-specific DNA-methyltransferase n=1 Tax=Methylomonas sp. HYX-M1 TaxID=3139307 RepID=UPI00345B61E0
MTSSNAFTQLQAFLKDMFQFGEHDLDFGLYRIIRLKRQFIENFIAGDGRDSLRAVVTNALSSVQNAQVKTSEHWLAGFAGRFGQNGAPVWQKLYDNPFDQAALDKYQLLFQLSPEEQQHGEQHLATWLEARQLDSGNLEAKVYNHLLNFFELYYQNGDFGYNSRAASAFKVAYEADYDGSDVLFHWKHKDSYYIKTGNGFHSVRFQLDAGELGERWLEFRLTQGSAAAAQSAERNNNKDSQSKRYRLAAIDSIPEVDKTVWQIRFELADANTPKTELYPRLWQTLFGDSDLTPYLYKKPGKHEALPGAPLFNDLKDDAGNAEGGQIKGIAQLRLKWDKYLDELAKRDEFANLGKNAEQRIEALASDAIANALFQLDKNLNKFYVGNDADYFIHKDLLGFLSREKSRFIKQVVFSDLESLLHAGQDNATVLIAQAFNQVADRLIQFLAAIENFQKGLFELKKQVVDSHYLISLGKIPAEFYPRLLDNAAQVGEWREVYGIDIAAPEQLAEHPALVVDTGYYAETGPDSGITRNPLQDDLLSHPVFDNLDEQTDGLLVNSENWQALNLLQDKFRGQIKTIYIDPPYNTGGDGFLYKDSFKHSSWASMIHDRLQLAYPLLSKNGVLFASIDDKERTQLETQLRQVFGAGNRVEELIWAQNSTKNQSPTYSNNHEYIEVFAKDLETVKAEPMMFREPKPGYEEMMELVARLNPDYPGIAAIEAEIAALFEQHRREFRAELEAQGLEFDKSLDLWKGLYNYSHAEYRDADGRYVPEDEARQREANIWIWQEADASMPLVSAGSKKPSVKDPNDPNYRFYQPLHPITGKPCQPPKRGWVWPRHPLEGFSQSFSEWDDDNRIAYGETEQKIPRLKRFIHEVDTNVGRSVITDYTDGEKELTTLLGKSRSFPNPKPTTLIERFIQQTANAGDWVLDFFAGSGTTGQAVMHSDRQRRFLLTEMGGYFDSILKPRIKRVMYSTHWQDGLPTQAGHVYRLIKVQGLEQYEDLLDNLHPVWDDASLPPPVPVKYLFRPEQQAILSTLDLRRPFANTLTVGKARQTATIDLLETWCYLQGYWLKSRRLYRKNTRPLPEGEALGEGETESGLTLDRDYLAAETTYGTLVLFRDIKIGEDDSAQIRAILSLYRIERLELNLDADLRQLPLPATLIQAHDFLRGAQWN